MSIIVTAGTFAVGGTIGAGTIAAGAGLLSAGIGVAGGLGSGGPSAPPARNLGQELSTIGPSYQNLLGLLTGGSGNFNTSGIAGLNSLVNGNFGFDAKAALASMSPEDQQGIAAAAAGYGGGITPEEWLRGHVMDEAAKGDPVSLSYLQNYSGQTDPGFGQIASGLNTANRTANLADVQNLAGQYTGIIRGANQPYYDQLGRFTDAANAPIQQGASQQQAAQRASSGFGTFDPSGLYANTNYASQTVAAPDRMVNVQNQNVAAPQASPLLRQLNAQAQANQGPSALQQGQNFYGMQALLNGGKLSESELRNVQQNSRAGFAARGLDATNASVVDEALQTDQAQRQRLLQNLGIAQNAQNQGLTEQNQQQQFGLGVSSQNFGYGQLGLQAQTTNAGNNLSSQLANQNAVQTLNQQGLQAGIANQGANLQAQGMGLQAQLANQNFGLGSFNANLSSQQAQQQALQQAAQLQEQQRQAQLQAQQAATQAQQAGRVDPYAAILGGTNDQLGGLLGLYGQNQNAQNGLLSGLLGYGQDLNNTNYNAGAAANIAGYNGQQALNGSLIGAGTNLLSSYLGSQGGAGGTNLGPISTNPYSGALNMSQNLLVCWVAREVYGERNPRWLMFRHWLFTRAPNWFVSLYLKHGERFAAWLKENPRLKQPIMTWMDSRIATLNYHSHV